MFLLLLLLLSSTCSTAHLIWIVFANEMLVLITPLWVKIEIADESSLQKPRHTRTPRTEPIDVSIICTDRNVEMWIVYGWKWDTTEDSTRVGECLAKCELWLTCMAVPNTVHNSSRQCLKTVHQQKKSTNIYVASYMNHTSSLLDVDFLCACVYLCICAVRQFTCIRLNRCEYLFPIESLILGCSRSTHTHTQTRTHTQSHTLARTNINKHTNTWQAANSNTEYSSDYHKCYIIYSELACNGLFPTKTHRFEHLRLVDGKFVVDCHIFSPFYTDIHWFDWYRNFIL